MGAVPAHKQVQKETKDRASPQSSRKVTLPDRFSMKGKVCVITGAARGLGFEFCRAFVEMYVFFRATSLKVLAAHALTANYRGCTSLAILDMQESAAREAAEEIIESYSA